MSRGFGGIQEKNKEENIKTWYQNQHMRALKGLKQLKQSCNQLANDPRQVPTSTG